MTEAEWLTCEEPARMLKFVKRKPRSRKLRLFACACCRRCRSVLRAEKNLRVLLAVEDFADDLITRTQMKEEGAKWYTFDYPFPLAGTWQHALSYAISTGHSVNLLAEETASHAARAARVPTAEQRAQARLLRDVFGNPFRPVAFAPEWRTDTAVALARQMYDAREFSAMPILADALQDAGCDSDDILDHCRDTNATHVLGCWVVDLVLGKS